VLGRGDDPANQSQPIGTFDPDRDGNMALIGTGGSGKSTALRTLASSAALAPGDGPVHVYGFDFASGSLRMLEPLPHVAAIVNGDDDERLGRVLRRLSAMLEDRSRRFAGVHASTITEYRRLTGSAEPRILLLVDGIGAFRDAYEHATHSSHFALFSQLATDGRMLGIHVVVTADRPGALSTSLASTIQRRLVLRQSSDEDYLLAGVPPDILTAAAPPGRAIMDGQELQIAVLGGDANVAVQGRMVEKLVTAMREKGFPSPEPVTRLSEHIALDSLPVTTPAGLLAVGIADETLEPIGLAAQGVLMVSGPPGSGRSATLLSLAQAVRRRSGATRIVYLAPKDSPIANAEVWSDLAVGVERVAQLADELMVSLNGRGPAPADLMVVVDSVAEFGGTEAEDELARMVKVVGDASGFVVGESEVSGWGQAWTLAQPFKASRRGIILAPSGIETDTLLSTPIGTVRRTDFPPGRGVLIEKGKGVWMQVAQPNN
jgi:S-DNA-T family DNA segregation ATPase FtsK/SpoIIIE